MKKFNFWCKVQAYIHIYRLAPCTKCKKFIFRDFVFSKNGCNFEPELHADADKRRSTVAKMVKKCFSLNRNL